MTKFAPGQSGNANGRPKGIKDRRVLLRECLESHVPDVVETVVAAALGGDLAACKLILDKALPNLRPVDSPISAKLDSNSEIPLGRQLNNAILDCEVTPSEALTLASAILRLAQVNEISELTGRLEQLEAHGSET